MASYHLKTVLRSNKHQAINIGDRQNTDTRVKRLVQTANRRSFTVLVLRFVALWSGFFCESLANTTIAWHHSDEHHCYCTVCAHTPDTTKDQRCFGELCGGLCVCVYACARFSGFSAPISEKR